MVDFLYVVTELFRCLLRLRRYKRKSVEVGVFRMGWITLTPNFKTEGSAAHQPLLMSEKQSDCRFVWYQNIRTALFGFVRKHACVGRTDRMTTAKSLFTSGSAHKSTGRR